VNVVTELGATASPVSRASIRPGDDG
jgi:hypothetical protein